MADPPNWRADLGIKSDGPDDEEATIKRLADLRETEYEKVREDEAKKLGFRVGFLDKLVTRERKNGLDDTRGQGQSLNLPAPQPWPEPVDGVTLFADLAVFFNEYAKLPERGANALALWAAHTHCYALWRYTPRLFITGPTKRCGKTRVLRLLKMVACKPVGSASISASAVYRTIEMVHPTLLIDEMDQNIQEKPELLGVLDGGFERGEVAIRAVPVGDDYQPRAFDLFAPCAMAGIGRLPGQLEDRSIRLPMQRAAGPERRPKIADETEQRGSDLLRQLARWVADRRRILSEAKPDLTHLPDRVDDRWLPLFAIAAAIGDNWPDLVEATAQALMPDDDEGDSRLERLIHDLQEVWLAHEPELASHAMVERLTGLLGRPWAEMPRFGKPLTQNQLARLLKPLGIRPAWIGREDGRCKGYRRTAFADAFARYPLPGGKP